jgi:hypothetical protein
VPGYTSPGTEAWVNESRTGPRAWVFNFKDRNLGIKIQEKAPGNTSPGTEAWVHKSRNRGRRTSSEAGDGVRKSRNRSLGTRVKNTEPRYTSPGTGARIHHSRNRSQSTQIQE